MSVIKTASEQLMDTLPASVWERCDDSLLAACADRYLVLFDPGTSRPRNPEVAQKLLKNSATLSFAEWVDRCNADRSLLAMQ